jgi:hypothetical protein
MANMSSLLTCDFFSFKKKLRIVLFFSVNSTKFSFGGGGVQIGGVAKFLILQKSYLKKALGNFRPSTISRPSPKLDEFFILIPLMVHIGPPTPFASPATGLSRHTLSTAQFLLAA